jgi:hypothetical protein
MGRKAITGERKWSQLRIRLTEEERATLDLASGDKGTSTWAREVLLREASKPEKPPKKRKA